MVGWPSVSGETAGRVRTSVGFSLDSSGKIQLHLFLCTTTTSVTYLEFLKDLKDVEKFRNECCYIFLFTPCKLVRSIAPPTITLSLQNRDVTCTSYMLDKVGRASQLSLFIRYITHKFGGNQTISCNLIPPRDRCFRSTHFETIFEIYQMQGHNIASSKIVQITSFWYSQHQGNKSLY